jgi:hypothetical protein
MKMYDDILQNVKLKIFIDGEYKGTIRNGDIMPKEWWDLECGDHTFGWEIDAELIEFYEEEDLYVYRIK